MTHARAVSEEKGDGKKISDHAAADQTRKSNASRATMSNRTPPSSRT
jgi:hypothetical protein